MLTPPFFLIMFKLQYLAVSLKIDGLLKSTHNISFLALSYSGGEFSVHLCCVCACSFLSISCLLTEK
jgi:hypothetical protein